MVQISASVSSSHALPPFLASSPPPERGFSATLSQLSGSDPSTATAASGPPLRQSVADPGNTLPGAAAIIVYAGPIIAVGSAPVPPFVAPAAASTSAKPASATVIAAPIDLTLPAADVVALKDLLPPIPLTTRQDDDDTPDAATSPDSPAALVPLTGALPLPAALPGALPAALPTALPPGVPVPVSTAPAIPATAVVAAAANATPPIASRPTQVATPIAAQPPSAGTAPVAPIANVVAASPLPAGTATDGTAIIIETGTGTDDATAVARPSVQTAPAVAARPTAAINTAATNTTAAPVAPTVPAAAPVPASIGIAQPAAIAFAGAIAAADTGVPARRRVDEQREPVTSPVAPTVPADRTTVIAAEPAAKPIDLRQQALAHGLADRIEALRHSADATSSRIRLVPQGLGTIDIALRRDGETLHVHFAADVAATRAALTEAQPKLAEIAAQRGLALGDTSVGDGAGRGAARQASGAPAAPVPVRPTRAGATEQAPSAHRIA